jgi:erythromycin esterase
MPRAWSTLSLLALAACSYDVAGEPPPPPLPKGAATLAPDGAGEAELANVGAIVGNAQVVGLGEATFRSGAITKSKAQIVRYLVEKRGFRAIAFESSFGQVEDTVRPYVVSCRGTAEGATLALDDHFHSTEMRDLTKWLCEYNRAHPADKVDVFGLVQDDTDYEARVLREFMTEAQLGEPSFMGAAAGGACPAPADATLSEADYTRCQGGLASVHAALTSREADLTKRFGQERYHRACTAVYALEEWQRSVKLWNEKRETESWDVREGGIYELFKHYRGWRAPNKRTILWAHGYTVSAAHAEIEAPRWARTTLGTMLRKDLGSGYKAVGVLGYDVGTREPGEAGSSSVAGADSFEAKLNTLRRPGLVLDLARLDPSVADANAAQPIGHPKSERAVPRRQLDGVVFIARSPEMTVLTPQN